MAPSVYIIGSLRNPQVPVVATALRANGIDAFDDWYTAGPEADDIWKTYELERGRGYIEALEGYHAQHVFHYDKTHLDRCDGAVLVLPAGKSCHLEFGYMIGQGKHGFVLLPENETERWDIMYAFATKVVTSIDELVSEVKIGGV